MEQTTKKRWISLSLRLALLLGCLGVGLPLLPWLWQGFAPFLLAFGVAFLLNPRVTRWAESTRLSRGLVVGGLLFFGFLLIFAVLWLILPAIWAELTSLGQQWESLFHTAHQGLSALKNRVIHLLPIIPSPLLDQLLEGGLLALQEGIAWWLGDIMGKIGQQAVRIPEFLLSLFVFFLSSYFMGVDFPKFQKKFSPCCKGEFARCVLVVRHSALSAFGSYLKAQILLSFGVFVLMLVGFWLIQVRFALLIALGIAFLDFIPMIGAGLVLLPWSAVGFLSSDPSFGWKLLAIWTATALFRRFAEPKVLGSQTGLSSLLSLVSIYVGLQWAGVWGMIIAPILVLVVLSCVSVGLFRPLWEDFLWIKTQITSHLSHNNKVS